MSRVSFQLLGTGNAFLPNGRLHSLLLIDEEILIDCPPTVITSLRREGIRLSEITSILFTHWHGDHYFGFPFFILERKYISDRPGELPLAIYHPAGGKEILTNLCQLAYPGSLDDALQDRCQFRSEDNGRIANSKGWEFERFAVLHDECVDPHGYVMKHESGFKLMHTGDSGPCESINGKVTDCDVVVIEMGVPDWVDTKNHFSPSKITTLAEENPSTTFIITHTYIDDPNSIHEPLLSSELPGLPTNCIQASDRMKWEWDEGKLRSID